MALTTAAGKLLLLDITAAIAAQEEAVEAAAAAATAAVSETGSRSSSKGAEVAGAATATAGLSLSGNALTAPVAGAGSDAEVDPAVSVDRITAVDKCAGVQCWAYWHAVRISVQRLTGCHIESSGYVPQAPPLANNPATAVCHAV